MGCHCLLQLLEKCKSKLQWGTTSHWSEWPSSKSLQIINAVAAAAAAKSFQSCPTLCNPIDGSPPGSPIPGILQARILEWVAISSSNAWKWKVKVKSLSHVWLVATPWTAAYQAPLSMGFSRQEYWSGVPLPSLKMMKVIKRANLLMQSIIRYFNIFETVLRQKGKNLKSCPWEVTDN